MISVSSVNGSMMATFTANLLESPVTINFVASTNSLVETVSVSPSSSNSEFSGSDFHQFLALSSIFVSLIMISVSIASDG